MGIKLFDSELKIMEILWREGDTTAKRIAQIAKEKREPSGSLKLIFSDMLKKLSEFSRAQKL
jgi:predicted transcriptional regulator